MVEALQQPLLLPYNMKGLRDTRQPELFMSLKRDMAMVSENFSYLFLLLHIYLCIILFNYAFAFTVQVTQQIFVAEEWAKKAREDLHNEAQSRCAVERTSGDLKKENDSLSNEVKEAKKGQASAEAGLKNATK